MQSDLDKPQRTDYLRFITDGRIGCATVTLLLFACITAGVFTGSLTHLDLETRAFIHHLTSPLLTASMRLLSTIGTTAFLAELFVFFFLGFLQVQWQEDAAWLSLTMAGSAVIVLIIRSDFLRHMVQETVVCRTGNNVCKCLI